MEQQVVFGKVAFTPKGEWLSKEKYERYDMTYKGACIYISLKDENKAALDDETAWVKYFEYGRITTEKIADEGITNEKLKDGLISWAKLDDNVKNIIASREEGGVALSNQLGNSEKIGISQKKLTEEITDIKRQVGSIADEEDLTVVKKAGLTQQVELKLKDKAYDPDVHSGMGRKYLRKNNVVVGGIPFMGIVENVNAAEGDEEEIIDEVFFDRVRERFVGAIVSLDPTTQAKSYSFLMQWEDYGTMAYSLYVPISISRMYDLNGVPYKWSGTDLVVYDGADRGEKVKNVLTQAMLQDADGHNLENTIFHIQYDYTLDGESIEVPAGSILLFEGGSISNGTLTGDFTVVKAIGTEVFHNVTLPGNVESIDKEVADLKAMDNDLSGRITEEANRAMGSETNLQQGIGGLDSRLQQVEGLAELSVEGGQIGIASATDFTNRTAEGDLKIPTVGAILNAADDEPTAGSDKLVKSKFVLDNKAEQKLSIDSARVPFEHRSIKGLGSGYLEYLDNDTRIKIELPSENIKSVKIIDKETYNFITVCLFENYIPTNKFIQLQPSSYTDIQNSIKSITNFVPNKILIVLSKKDGSSLIDVTDIQDIIDIKTIYGTSKQYYYKKPLYVYSSGVITYDDYNKSITFTAGTKIIIRDINLDLKTVTINENTSFIFNNSTTTFVFLRGEQILGGISSDIKDTDLVLFFFSWNAQSIAGGELFNSLEIQANKLEIQANTNESQSFIGANYSFEHGGYVGVSSGVVSLTSANIRCRFIVKVSKIKSIRFKNNYKGAAILLQNCYIPTSVFYPIRTTATSGTINIKEYITEAEFDVKYLMCTIVKGNNEDMSDLESIDDAIEIIPEDGFIKTTTRITQKSFCCMQGSISQSTGLYPTLLQYYVDYSYTPSFIKYRGKLKVLSEWPVAVFWYDQEQNIISYETKSEAPYEFENDNAYFFRIRIAKGWIRNAVIESYWEGDDEVYQKLPIDDGYQHLTFGVHIKKGVVLDNTSSQIDSGFVKTLNHGVIHLPESYRENCEATPLIIYLHGAAERYSVTSNRFGNNVRYSPEWSAAGFAQLDVDMTPEIYNTGTTSGTVHTGDDYECVVAAYQWVINHFNIRKDGVYLFGRSRGGMAVLSILGKYNYSEMPIICALSNAGANSMLLYGLFRQTTATWWRIFCESNGLDTLNPPTYTSGLLVDNYNIVEFLRNNIDIWWDKTMVALRLIVNNPTEYKTPIDIFNLLVSSYTSSSNKGKTFIQDFVEKCEFRSPVPLRFDWCAGDTIQTWESTSYGNYGSAGKNGFVNNKLTGNAIYRRWPSCPSGNEPHYHEKFNLYEGQYTLPNGAVVENPSMAQVEWLLWALSQDNRFIS